MPTIEKPAVPLPPRSTVRIPPKIPGRWEKVGGKFALGSVLLHLLLCVLAWLIVQSIHASTRTFQGGPKGAYALEHSVHVQKMTTLNAPPHARRITTTGLSTIQIADVPPLPPLEKVPTPPPVAPVATAAPTPAATPDGGAKGTVAGSGGKAGTGSDVFGVSANNGGLAGTFYDLKQTPNRQPTGMTIHGMETVMSDFVRRGFNPAAIQGYYRAPKPVYATQIFTPMVHAELGPAAFGIDRVVQPRMWLIHYKGKVIAPESGTYDFVGFGDDYLVVKFNGRMVFDGSLHPTSSWTPPGRYLYPSSYNFRTGGTPRGDPFTVRSGQVYPIEVVIGEQPGGWTFADLLIEKAGASYRKDAGGNPLLPIFRLATSAPVSGGTYLPHDNGGAIWKYVESRPGY